MIPVSRRTIASAKQPLAVGGEAVEVDPGELTLGRPGPRRLGEQRDEQRQHPVDVVEAVGRLVAGSSSSVPSSTWITTRLRHAQQVPEPDARPARSQAIPPTAPARRFVASTATPTIRWAVSIGGG